MTAAHNRAARREREAAALLGTRRVHRSRFERAPDLLPIRLTSGELVQPEVKTRKRLPALIQQALSQAQSYQPDAVPLGVLSATGGAAVACLLLEDFARIAGIAPARLGQMPLSVAVPK